MCWATFTLESRRRQYVGLVPVGISSVASSNRDLLNDAGENLTALGVRGGYLC